MKPLLILTLATAFVAGACTTMASDTANTDVGPVNAEVVRVPAAAARSAYRDVMIPAGTSRASQHA